MVKDAIRRLAEIQAKAKPKDFDVKALCAMDVMIKPVIVYSHSNSKVVLDKLKKEKVNSCIVVSQKKEPVGIISDEDIIKLFVHQVEVEPLVKLFNRGYVKELRYKDAKSLMHKTKYSVNINSPLNVVIKTIWTKRCRYLPVVGNDGKIVGVITPSKIIKLLGKIK